MDYREFQNLEETSVEAYESVDPENEFFHSVYIGGEDRTNKKDILERAGFLHVRGVDYNLDEVYMVVIHVKTVLVKRVKNGKKEKVTCFCYQSKTPWLGTCGNECPRTSAERKATQSCADCKSEYILAGVLTDKNGRPKKGADDKFIFAFVRGKGMKYAAIFEYVAEMSKLDLTPICTPVTPESLKFEKSNVNIRRFVTKITKGYANSQHGQKSVFKFSYGNQLPDSQVPNILKIAQSTIDKFHEKFDWSKTLGKKNENVKSDYVGEMKSPISFDDSSGEVNRKESKAEPEPTSEPDISFEDCSF